MSTDLVTDQRVHKVSMSLQQMGFFPLLIGRRLRGSLPMDARTYPFRRFFLLFETGPLFYAEYNIRLFFYLLFAKTDLIVSNDLDTLAACYMASALRRKPLVYDSHEFFTGVPEIQNRPFVKKTWLWIEKMIFSRLKTIFTVNQSIAGLYHELYGKTIHVLRNIPFTPDFDNFISRSELGLPDGKHLVMLQGSGINVDRGAEELVMAFEPQYGIEDAVLVIAGSGDVIPKLKNFVNEKGMNDRVLFFSRMPYSKLLQYTRHASLGATLDKDTNVNYRFSLPNKIFDYIHCEVPVLASDLPEIKRIVQQYEVGVIVPDHQPSSIAGCIKNLLANPQELNRMKSNARIAAQELNWENESDVIRKVYGQFL